MITSTSYTNSTLMGASLSGYWGHPTASDWCESNYSKSYYIAEYFNSLSSFSMILVGLIGMYLHSSFEKRFLLTFGSIVVVGIGSIAFHGTLLFPLQMLDEVPMVYCVLTGLYCCVENKPYRRYGAWFPIGLTLYGLLTTVIMMYAGPENHLLEFIVFQSSFGFVILTLLSYVIKIYARVQDQSIKRMWSLAGLIGAVAYGYWNVDFRMCHTMENLPFGISNPQFHAWWHVGASMASYIVCLLLCYDRADNLERKPRIEWIGGVLPRVVIDKELARKNKAC
ncbi:Alkaline ceramidase 3 [Mortierella sp. AM989]|nr:Alkaline ceramidase 3 [Mortierella sp. AM989]